MKQRYLQISPENCSLDKKLFLNSLIIIIY